MPENESIYSAPNSDLSDTSEGGGLDAFKRFSAWGVFGLGLVTLGIYSFYWLYSRANAVNSVVEDEISNTTIFLFLATYVSNTILSIFVEFIPDNSTVDIVVTVLGLVTFVYYLILVYSIRSRLADILDRPLNGIMTFFFATIYFQYHINTAKDK